MRKIVLTVKAERTICIAVPDDFDVDDYDLEEHHFDDPHHVSELCDKLDTPRTDWRVDENEGVDVSEEALGFDDHQVDFTISEAVQKLRVIK